MFWADILLENRTGKEVVNDSWTPSGIVHMGSLKGPIIHDVFYRVLKEKGSEVKFMYGFDDFDPIDGLPADLKESLKDYMGVPVCMAPSPDGNGTFGDYYGNKMAKLLNNLGIQAEFYKTSNFYKEGKFDDAIKFVLNHAQEVRDVYSSIYKKEISKDWFPLQVICPQCGKLGTTKVIAWDGEKVKYICSTDLVEWAKGCGQEGEMSPFAGNGKMPWKVEWAAKWYTFGITIEGAGKDHASAGGSYDVAMEIVDKVFKKPRPLKFGYEFFLTGGKKMSSSKGLGMTGEELLEILTPQAARFLMIKTRPEQTVEFDPRSPDIIPRIYDDYQKGAVSDDELGRAFELSQVGEREEIPSVRFSVLAQWVQMPGMEEEIKKAGAEKWAKYARVWIEKYAPESEKFLVQQVIPSEASNLSDQQKEYLKKISELVEERDVEKFQTSIYQTARDMNLAPKEAFAAIYIALIGKDHGPRAAWLISSLDPQFVKQRFTSVADNNKVSEYLNVEVITPFNKPDIFTIDQELLEKYPSISVGIAIIKGVRIEKTTQALEDEKDKLTKSLEDLTPEEIGEHSQVKDYRKLYKEMGVDWHSKRPSPEALLRRIATKKGLYTINTCVDAYNLVVMKNKISIGAFDLDNVKFPTVLRFAKSGENILLLGDSEPTEYTEKEIAYFDSEGGYNMDFNYRDAQRTAVQLDTQNLLINVDGVFGITPSQVEKTLKEACEAIIKYCGGTIEEFGIVTAS